MSLRGNLFVKIFLGFWLATIAVLGSWLVAARYFESLPAAGPASVAPGPPPRFMMRMHYSLENSAIDALPGYLEELKRRHGVDVFLVNRADEDLFDRPLDPEVLEVADKLRGRPNRASLDTPRGHPVRTRRLPRRVGAYPRGGGPSQAPLPGIAAPGQSPLAAGRAGGTDQRGSSATCCHA